MMTKKEYNDIPIEFCGSCGSLHLLNTREGVVCGNCGTLNYTKQGDIDSYIKNNEEINSKLRT